MTLRSIVLTMSMLGACATATAADYAVQVLNPAGATSAVAWDVNNVGQVVGYYSSAAFKYSRSYVWSAGSFNYFSGPVGAINSAALGISDGGVVVGSYSDTEVDDGTGTGTLILGPSHGFLLQGGVYTQLDVPGADGTELRGISADGRFVSGYSTTGDVSRGFVFDRTSSAFTFLGATTPGSLTIVQGINALGQLVGAERSRPGNSGPFARTSFICDIGTGVRTDQNLAGYTRTAFRDINDDGAIAGFGTLNGATVGFITGSGGPQSFAFGSLSNTILEGINNAGWAVGDYQIDADGNTAAILLTPVPEPSTWALWLGGLFGLSAWARRRPA